MNPNKKLSRDANYVIFRLEMHAEAKLIFERFWLFKVWIFHETWVFSDF